MAITRAQQVRQMLNGGGAPSNRGDIGGNQPSRGESLHGGESVKDAVRRGELKEEIQVLVHSEDQLALQTLHKE